MGTTQSLETEFDFAQIKFREEIKFHLQDVEHSVKTDNITPSTSLNYYLRNQLNLTGTKAMCHEGGCGSCIVVQKRKDPLTNKDAFLAINSCLVPLLSCNGLKIYTVEGIGGTLTGYHPIQKTLAQFNGTQCGFCSPGMVMNMYALYESGKLTMSEVENSFGGNICRCTGYRPILAAFKSLCNDACTELLGNIPDIENLKLCEKKCTQECDSDEHEPFYHSLKSSKWIKVYVLNDLLAILKSASSYKLVAGNTAQGVFKSYSNCVDVYIEISSVSELISYQLKEDSLVLGANVTLSNAMEIFRNVSNDASFSYLKEMANHIDLIANVPVRNVGTLAGNLMIKHDHNDFPSDIFLILETVNAKLVTVSNNGDETTMSPKEFMTYDMKQKVLKSIILFKYTNFKYVRYKIMPRSQNTHAHVNAGFFYQFNSKNLIEKATIIFGNINPNFVHATTAEQILTGKDLFNNDILQEVYSALSKELEPDYVPPEPQPEYRKQLAIALFYKSVLSIAPDQKITPRNKSGASILERPISKGVQDYETNVSLYPLTQPIPKLEALAQTSGQAEYIDDMPNLPGQLFGALVLAQAPPNSKITNIDPQKALASQGVVAFYSKDDIPGENNFTPLNLPLITSKEEVFCSGRVQYYDQPIGILVGTTLEEVQNAIQLVDVTYDISNVEPLLSVRQILEAKRSDRIHEVTTIEPKRKGSDVKHVVKGSFDIYHQYHFHMETQCCNVVPTEDGLKVYPSTQWMDLNQQAIAKFLNIPNNKIDVTVRRCGGGFGGKISRNGLISCAAAIASWKLQKPVKLSLPLSTNIATIGKRWPLSCDYEVGVDDKGVVQYLECTHYTDVGAQANEDNSNEILSLFTGSYNSDTFKIQINKAVTDTHTNTWARAPGTTEGLASIEAILEHIAYECNLDPLEVRISNFIKDSPLIKYVNDLKSWANIDARKQEILTYNQNNRWKKRGFAVVPMTYHLGVFGPFGVMVTIFHSDGSIQVSHGGVEVGQGINTKVAQVCAYKLGVPLEKVAVVPSSSFVAANSNQTGGSFTSEAVCYGVTAACDQLLERIKPVRDKNKDLNWEQLIEKCYQDYVDLVARGQYSPKVPNISSYPIYGICACEVQVDILTGQYIVTRVDLIEDTGQSMSPEIDIGQIEGAFVMGMGYYTTEKIVFNFEGKIITNNTWTYHPPLAKDIPVDFNVKFPKNNPNPVGILKSKATGEPAVCLTVSVPLAIRNAVASARSESALKKPNWYPFDGPTNIENVYTNCLNNYTQYTL